MILRINQSPMTRNDSATKADLDQVALATLKAIEQESQETRQYVRDYVDKRITQTEAKILDAIANLKNVYDLDRRLKRVEDKLGIEA